MHDNAAKLLGLQSQASSVPVNGTQLQDMVGDIVRQIMLELKNKHENFDHQLGQFIHQIQTDGYDRGNFSGGGIP